MNKNPPRKEINSFNGDADRKNVSTSFSDIEQTKKAVLKI